MDFAFSEEQTALRGVVRDFARAELAPHYAEWDRTGHFPRHLEIFEQITAYAGSTPSKIVTTLPCLSTPRHRGDAGLAARADCPTDGAFLWDCT